MKINVAVSIMPVESRGAVVLEVSDFTNHLHWLVARRLAAELISASNRARKLGMTVPVRLKQGAGKKPQVAPLPGASQ